MKALVKSLICAATFTLVSGTAFAQSDDGFAPPQAAPTQRVATADLTPSGTSAVPTRAWSPDSDAPQTRYATQNSPGNESVEQQAAAQQPVPPAPQPPAPQTRYSSQGPADNFQPVPAQQPAAQPQQAAPPLRYASQSAPPATTNGGGDYGYHLGSGDKVRVIVYGEDDLGGEFDVDSTGFVRLPLIGQVQAAGLTVRDFEQMVTQRLADGYLKAPRVSVDVTAYRPFFIIGEVGKPGEYAYVNGMNVVTAVALAGGYTYRADNSDVYVRRNGSRKEEELPANERTIIYPGDIIRISERFF
jgi:polysaccharide export outer membrane protein